MCKKCVSKSGRLLGAGRTGLGTGSAAIALFMPKCPLCVAAWAWTLSAFGVEFDRWDAIKWPLTVVFLLLAALLLGFKARPWVKAAVLIGSGFCLSFKFAEDSTSFGLALAFGIIAPAAVAIAYLVFCRFREARLTSRV
jgi:hypothetical protein